MLIQGYIGMNPADKGCVNWNDMQQKMADEILAMLQPKKFEKKQIPIPRKEEVKIFEGWDKKIYCKSPDNSVKVLHKKGGVYKIPGLPDLKKISNYTDRNLHILQSTADSVCFRLEIPVVPVIRKDKKVK